MPLKPEFKCGCIGALGLYPNRVSVVKNDTLVIFISLENTLFLDFCCFWHPKPGPKHGQRLSVKNYPFSMFLYSSMISAGRIQVPGVPCITGGGGGDAQFPKDILQTYFEVSDLKNKKQNKTKQTKKNLSANQKHLILRDFERIYQIAQTHTPPHTHPYTPHPLIHTPPPPHTHPTPTHTPYPPTQNLPPPEMASGGGGAPHQAAGCQARKLVSTLRGL